MSDLTEFLLARIAEDEARFDEPKFYEVESARGPGWGNRGDCPICGAYQFDGTEDATEQAWYEHAENVHQRTRALAECKAKRAIIELHKPGLAPAYEGYEKVCSEDRDDWPCPTLRVLASVYSDHPGYRPEWRP